MTPEDRLREYIRKEIEEMFTPIDEITTTGDVAGYLTPYAFTGDKKDNMNRIKSVAKMIGYKITDRGKEDIRKGDKLDEVYGDFDNYYDWRYDSSTTSQQKIGQAISEVNKRLRVIEKIIRRNKRLKKQEGVSNNDLWKRTQKQIIRLENRLIKLAGKLREMRG